MSTKLLDRRLLKKLDRIEKLKKDICNTVGHDIVAGHCDRCGVYFRLKVDTFLIASKGAL